VIATGNIGCMVQIGRGLVAKGLAIPIVHTIELLDWATGGPKPPELRGVAPAPARQEPAPAPQATESPAPI
jgi:glycolate oxidase iron-sulfur subunit